MTNDIKSRVHEAVLAGGGARPERLAAQLDLGLPAVLGCLWRLQRERLIDWAVGYAVPAPPPRPTLPPTPSQPWTPSRLPRPSAGQGCGRPVNLAKACVCTVAAL